MLKFGMQLGPSGAPVDRRHKQHIDGLWTEFATIVAGRIGAQYVAMLPIPNPFTNWSIHNRYSNRCHFTSADVTHHRKGAEQVQAVVKKAQQDGVL